MREFKRILSNRRILLGLLLIVLVNGFLFAREQFSHNYGLDCSLPNTVITIFNDETSDSGIDPKTAYKSYLNWLEKTKQMPLNNAVSMLNREKARLTDILRIAKLIEKGNTFVGISNTLDDYRMAQPELLRQIERGEIDISAAELDYIAVNNLLINADYLTGYDNWLNSIQRNKENMQMFSLFETDSFSGRNIVKTADEFEKLRGVSLSLGADGAVNSFMSFSLTDYFMIAVLLIIVMSFFEERKAGLEGIIHAAPYGRARLALQRTVILFGVSFGGVLLLYGLNLAIGFSIFGGIDDLTRAVQSMKILGKLPVLCSVGSFLIYYLILRVLASFFIGLLFWLLLSAVNNVKYTIIIAAVLLAVEYSLYTFLPVQSVWNGLKYFNLFTYISLSDLYTNYLNINIFDYPIDIRTISQFALLPMCMFLAAACVFIYCKKKPAGGKDLLGKIAYRIRGVTEKVLCRLGLLGTEAYKTLWIQKGVVIFALFVYVVFKLPFSANIPLYSAAESAEQKYIGELSGEITDETFSKIDSIMEQLDKSISDYEKAKIDFENGIITKSQLNLFARDEAAASSSKEGLDRVRDRANELKTSGTDKGFIPWLIDEMPFESVYGTAAQNNQHRTAVIAVLALTLLLAGSMVYERRSNMTFLSSSTVRGRGILLSRKLLLAVFISAAVWAVVYGCEVYILITKFDIREWDIAVQNLSMLTEFPIHCSIRGWLIFLYAHRLLVLICGAMIVLLISSLVKRMELAYVAACGVMLLPSVLYAYMGVRLLKPLAYIVGVEGVPLLFSENGKVAQLLIWSVVLIIVAGTSVAWLCYSLRKRT